jgi:probable nitrogen fixation protein
MTSVALLQKPQLAITFEELFLQELIEQFHIQDRSKVYQNWSDYLLLELFTTSKKSLKNFNLDHLNQLLMNAFYHAIAKTIEQKTGYSTQTFVHVKNKEYSSAVVFCGGVLVVYSLIWGYKKYGFNSIDRLLEEAEKIIEAAMAKASPYLDFAA